MIDKNLKDWKYNKNIVFNSKKHKFVLLKGYPPKSTANVAKTKKDTYENWIALDDIACCYMLVSISNVLRQKCQGMQTTVEYHGIISNRFGETSNRAQFNIVKAIMNSRMKDGSKPHCTYN